MSENETAASESMSVEGVAPASEYLVNLRKLVDKWVRLLKMTHWDVTVEIGGEDFSDHASIEITDEEQEAVVTFRPEHKADKRYTDNYLACHEICHLQVYDLLPPTQNKTQKREEERYIRKLSRLLTRLEEEASGK